MQPPQQHSWINPSELKSQIIRKLGPARSKQYFDYLNKFLSLKLSKLEFDKLCLRTIGKDGIRLHNQLIRSIVRSACTEEAAVGNKNHASTELGFSNGDILSTSPRKARTGVHRRGGDRKSGLGPNEKTNTSLDNGNPSSPDTQTPMQHHQELIQQDGKDVSGKISLHAPLGIPFYPVSTSGARRAPPSKTIGVSDTNSLLDATTLRARMEPISVTQGLQGVSPDSANALNIGLDAYLKGLIRTCCERKSNPAHFRPVNYQMQEHERKHAISLLDFRVAMELNPQPLGEDWPVLLEKIHDFEE